MPTPAATTIPLPSVAAAPASRGWQGLPCLYCAETDCITIDLSDMTGDEALKCGQCETSFSLDDVRAKMKAWAPVLAWCELAPVTE